MSNKEIQRLLSKLHEEVQETELDAGARSSLQELSSDIQDLLDTSTAAPDTNRILERANLLESKFAVNHPAIERFMREVIDTLTKMGV